MSANKPITEVEAVEENVNNSPSDTYDRRLLFLLLKDIHCCLRDKDRIRSYYAAHK